MPHKILLRQLFQKQQNYSKTPHNQINKHSQKKNQILPTFPQPPILPTYNRVRLLPPPVRASKVPQYPDIIHNHRPTRKKRLRVASSARARTPVIHMPESR